MGIAFRGAPGTSVGNRMGIGPAASSVLRLGRLMVIAVAATLLLSGCLITRLYAFKQQFCDLETYFAFETGKQFRIVLLDPVLRGSDVVWLAGAPPTETSQHGDIQRMRWVIEKIYPPGVVPVRDERSELSVDLDFVTKDDHQLLQAVVLAPRFEYLAAPGMLDEQAGNICEAKWLVRGRTGEIDLADADFKNLPTRQEVVDWFGAPVEWLEQGSGLRYAYRLRNDPNPERSYLYEMWFDLAGTTLLKTRSKSIRYTTTTDYVRRKMLIELNR